MINKNDLMQSDAQKAYILADMSDPFRAKRSKISIFKIKKKCTIIFCNR